jgi:hypothetical protein
VGEIVRFVEENGQVVRVVTGDSYSIRVRQRVSAQRHCCLSETVPAVEGSKKARS